MDCVTVDSDARDFETSCPLDDVDETDVGVNDDVRKDEAQSFYKCIYIHYTSESNKNLRIITYLWKVRCVVSTFGLCRKAARGNALKIRKLSSSRRIEEVIML